MKFIFLFLIILPVFLGIHNAYAHGIGGETLPPVQIDNRNVTIQISVEPAIFDEKDNQHKFLVKFFDIDTGNQINNVTFQIELKHNGNLLLSDKFFDKSGNLVIDTIDDAKKISIFGNHEPILGGWMTDGNNPVTIHGPLFSSGGLYGFKIKILSYSTVSALENPVTFDGAISIAETTLHTVVGEDDKNYNVGITSYYDQISKFGYENRKISFSMPFDWSTKNISKTNIVHEEIHIPKTFADFLFPNYDVYANGILLSKDASTIDDYSEDDRIIHIILYQNTLFELQNDSLQDISFEVMPSKDIDFPLSSQTTSLEFKVNFWWEPTTIIAGQDTIFDIAISEQYVATKSPRPVEYDFVITQYDQEIFREHEYGTLNSANPDKIRHVFSAEQKGPIEVHVEKIDGKYLADANFVTVVNAAPEDQKFPIRLPSKKIGVDTMDGKYFVDLTWIPSSLDLYEESEFIITIYDKSTLRPVPQAKYDFVLDKDGTEIFRKSGFASAGGSFEDFRFLDNHVGQVTLKIENIAGTDEFVEIPLNVTPEFSQTVGIVLVISVIFGVVMTRKKIHVHLQ